MKVALISEWVDAWRGGAETSTFQFLYHVLEKGVDVHLFTRSRPAAVPGLVVRHIGGAAMSRTRRSMTFAHRVEQLIGRESFDVRHAITACRCADVYQPRGGTVVESIERNLALIESDPARAIKRLANRFNAKQRYALRLERRLMSDPNGPVVIAISDYVVRQLKHHYNLPDMRIRKVYNGVDRADRTDTELASVRRSLRREFAIGDDELLVLLVAHNFKLKGVGRWLEALALLRARGNGNVRSIVVGKGDDPRWRRRAGRLGVADAVRYIGPSDRVRNLYLAADVLVHPTYYDPCSRVVLEAMVEGLPCVTTRWDGASEMIVDGENGYVLNDPGDVSALADRVLDLCDAQKRQSFRHRAVGIAPRVSMKRHAEAVLDVYRELVARSEPGRSNADPIPAPS